MKHTRDPITRPLAQVDSRVLWDMLYEAVYVPDDQPRPPRDIVNTPEIAVYAEAWGRAGDVGIVAQDPEDAAILGAAWFRLFPSDARGFGFVDAETPELAIALAPGRRGQGLGTRLLSELLERARPEFAAISLSVDAGSRAVGLYRRFGFCQVAEHGTSLTMLKRLRG